MIDTPSSHNQSPWLTASPPSRQTLPCFYVHLMSGAIEELRPADSVRIWPDAVIVLHGEREIARYAARDVLFCSHLDVSPFPCS